MTEDPNEDPDLFWCYFLGLFILGVFIIWAATFVG